MTRILAVFAPMHRHAALAIGLLVLAIILGGGGTPNPSTEVLLGILAGLTAIAWIWLPGPIRRPNGPWSWIAALLVCIIPLLQLVPLPPSSWQGLPGRDIEVSALRLIGEAQTWQPFTTSRPRTFASLLSLIPPLLLLFAVASLRLRHRSWIIAAIAVMAIVSAALGATQLAAGSASPRLYEASSTFVVTGFQANRNAEVDVLLIGILALVTFAAGSRSVSPNSQSKAVSAIGWWLVAFVLVLTLAAILTASRGGILLIAPTLLAGWAILASDPAQRWNKRLRKIVMGVLALAIAGAALLQTNTAIQKVAARFDVTGDARTELWRDTIYAIEQFWPWGTGIGTFVPTFIALEPLEVVDASTPNRAHNDFLELTLEAGVFGIVVLTLLAGMIIALAVRSWRRNSAQRVQILFALSSLIIVAAHSLVDYPMRSMALACLAAASVALLVPGSEQLGHTERPNSTIGLSSRRWGLREVFPRVFLTLLGLGFLFAIWGSGLDRLSLRSPALERLVPEPFRASADRSAAGMALARGEHLTALRFAERAVSADPLDPSAASLLGAARQFTGDRAGADAAFRIAAQRGWRDRLTQLYWYGAALQSGDLERAAMRADALLRTGNDFIPAGPLLEPLESTAAGRLALARRLSENPGWSGSYLTPNSKMTPVALSRRVEVLNLIADMGRPLGCDIPRPLTANLLARGMRREAERLWSAHCSQGGPTKGLADSGFNQLVLEGRNSPFGWIRHTDGDVEVAIVDTGEGGKAVRAQSVATVTKLVLSQSPDVGRGRYRVRAKIGADGTLAADRVIMSLDCNGSARRPSAAIGRAAQSGQTFTLESCTRPVLGIWLRPGREAVTIDDVVLEKVG